jgi:hypothetical protein
MSKTNYLMLALAGSALPAVPAQAQLLGGLGGGGDCLCQAVSGVLGSVGSPNGGLIGNGSIVGSVTGSVNKALDVTVNRSIDPRGGSGSANAGIAGSVSGVANAAVGANGLGKSIGLAGSSSTDASANKNAGLSVSGIGTNHAKSLAGQAGGAATAIIGKAHGEGQGASSSLTGAAHAATNNALSVTKSHGGSGGEGGSKSLTGTLNSASNGAVNLTKRHGSSGEQGRSGASLAGSLNSTANGALSLTKAAGASGGQGSSGKQGAGSASKAESASPRGRRASREGDRADRKDLWWPQHTEGSHREGRLQDH